jgi:hypothetical protein
MTQRDLGEEPDIVHVWVCRIKGSTQHVSVRATRDRAEHWIEEKVGRGGEWVGGPAAKTLYRTESGDENGLIELCPIPDCLGLVVTG